MSLFSDVISIIEDWIMWSFFSRDPTKDFSYEISPEKVPGLDDKSIWTLHKGKKKVRVYLHYWLFFDIMQMLPDELGNVIGFQQMVSTCFYY